MFPVSLQLSSRAYGCELFDSTIEESRAENSFFYHEFLILFFVLNQLHVKQNIDNGKL